MNVGVLKIVLRLPGNRSLKGKRRTISSLTSRVRERYGVTVAEVGCNESWQTAEIGVACVSNSVRHADEALDRVLEYVEASREDVEVLDSAREVLSGF